MAKIELIKRDIKAEIAELMINYILLSKTINVSSTQRAI